jgi:hypothetical protein
MVALAAAKQSNGGRVFYLSAVNIGHHPIFLSVQMVLEPYLFIHFTVHLTVHRFIGVQEPYLHPIFGHVLHIFLFTLRFFLYTLRFLLHALHISPHALYIFGHVLYIFGHVLYLFSHALYIFGRVLHIFGRAPYKLTICMNIFCCAPSK